MSTSSDVAKAAGVSQSTVSRVINSAAEVAPATRLRVLRVIEDMGYTPNALASALVTSRTGLIGVVVSDLTNPFYPEFVEAVTAHLAKFDLKMVFFNAGVTTDREDDDFIRMLLGQRVDGIIFASAVRDSNLVKQMAERGFPIVVANRYADGLKCDSAVGENRAGAAAVAKHLAKLGHVNIGVVCGYASASTSRDRLEGFCDGMRASGVEVHDRLIRVGNFDADVAATETTFLLDSDVPPTAIFCLNDAMAFGALNAIRARGMSVPRDISVVGFDDVRMASWDVFNLTTVHQPLAEMARASVDLLARRIANPSRDPQHLVFPTTLVERGTTAQLGGLD